MDMLLNFLLGAAFGAGLVIVAVGCFSKDRTEDAYAIGYQHGFFAGSEVTAEQDIANEIQNYAR